MRASDIGIVSPVDGAMVTSGAAQVTINRIDDAGIRLLHRGRQGLLPRRAAAARRTTCSPTWPRSPTLVEHDEDAAPDDYLPWGDARATSRRASRRARLAATFSGGHTTNWTFQDGTLRQREHLRRRRRRVPGRHRAGAAGQGRRRRLPRPGRQPGAGDAVRRAGPGDDLPRRPAGRAAPGPRTALDARAHAVDQGRRADGARPAARGSSWCRRTAADVTFGK